MAHLPGMKHGAWCHIEIPAASVEAAKRFYGGLFGWKFSESPAMKYTLFNTGEGEIGGGLFTPPPGTPRQITGYVTVGDLEASAKKVRALGGRVATDRMEVPGFGCFRIVADPDGNSFGLWQSMHAPTKRGARKKPARGKKKRS